MVAAFAAAMFLSACSSDNKGDEPSFPDSPSQPETGKIVSDLVIYEANPRFFGQNDCLNTLTSNLKRISDMGCDVVWLMPVCEPSTAPQSVGSPYSTKNYEALNPKYGTMADLQNLVKTAHGLGMKVILDWVPNHTGWDNPWITEHPGWFMHNASGDIISPPGQNWKDVAQLNYNDPDLWKGMTDAMLYWVTNADIDGFRLDYADSPNIPADFWKGLASDLRAKKSHMLLLAESSNYSFYDYGYDMIYDWHSAPTLATAFKNGKPAPIIQEAEGALGNVPEGKSILRYVFNHDTMSENPIDSYYGSIDALPAAYVCASMLNGTPLIYSGMDAEGLKGSQSFFNYTTLTFSDKFTPIYKAINSAFKESVKVRGGALTDLTNGSMMMFMRKLGDSRLFVAVNTTAREQTFQVPMAVFAYTFNDLLNGGTVTTSTTMTLPPYGYTILMN